LLCVRPWSDLGGALVDKLGLKIEEQPAHHGVPRLHIGCWHITTGALNFQSLSGVLRTRMNLRSRLTPTRMTHLDRLSFEFLRRTLALPPVSPAAFSCSDGQ